MPVRRVAPMPLGLAGARRVPGLARLLRARAAGGLPRPPELAARRQVGACGRGARPRPGGVATVQLIPEYGARPLLRCAAAGARAPGSAATSRSRETSPDELVEPLRLAGGAGRGRLQRRRPRTLPGEPAPPGLRAELTGGEDRPLVLTAARLDEQKGHPVLLRAAAELPEALFVARRRGAGAGGSGGARGAARDRRSGPLPRPPRRTSRSCSPPATSSPCPPSTRAPRWRCWRRWRPRRPVVSSAIGGTDELIDGRRATACSCPRRRRRAGGGAAAAARDGELRAALAARPRRARVERDFSRTRWRSG